MSECSVQDPFEEIDIDKVLFSKPNTQYLQHSTLPSHTSSTRRFVPTVYPNHRRRQDSHFDDEPPALLKQKYEQTTSLAPTYNSASIGPVHSGLNTIPKKSSQSTISQFSRDTHERDRAEFSWFRSSPNLPATSSSSSMNVAGEYSSLVACSSPKRAKYSTVLDMTRQRKHSFLSSTAPAGSLSPMASNFRTHSSRSDPWSRSRLFTLKTNLPSTSSSLLRSASDVVRPVSNSLSSPRQRSRSPRSVRPRPGSTVENPVELSDDEVEEEERELEQEWDGLSTDIAIGHIWLGRCRLVCHGPSRLRLDLTKDLDRKNLTIEFTPYMIEKIPVRDIVCTKLYSRLSGGCTFLSVSITDRHKWQPWVVPYKFRSDRSDPVWVTMFFGSSSQRQVLERAARELPSFEEVVCPSDHLDLVGRDLTDQYPYQISMLDSDSRANRRRARNQTVCKYPLGSRDCVTITNGDLESLNPCEYLNDTVIDFKLAYLRLNDLSPKISYHVFSSFFYKRFVTSNMSYDSVKRWTDKLDLFQKEFWLIPICESLHWTLAVVCYPNIDQSDDRKPVMLYYDSLGGSGRRAHGVIKKYITAALKQPKRLRTMDSMLKIETDFQLIDVQAPRQTNSYDCGIYLLLFAEYFLKSPPDDVCSPHEPDWFDHSVADAHRDKIRDEILRIAYRQSPGSPGPVSTEYVKMPSGDVHDDNNLITINLDDSSVISADDTTPVIV